jgi:hypothetical protein
VVDNFDIAGDEATNPFYMALEFHGPRLLGTLRGMAKDALTQEPKGDFSVGVPFNVFPDPSGHDVTHRVPLTLRDKEGVMRKGYVDVPGSHLMQVTLLPPRREQEYGAPRTSGYFNTAEEVREFLLQEMGLTPKNAQTVPPQHMVQRALAG